MDTSNLKIDAEFRDKIPPLTEDEFKRLEENIVADGIVREPLVVWNGTIVDGHHRWAIIQKHPEIPYTIKEMDFADRWAAISWMCSNQLGRRNITDAQRTYLLGKLYEARKNTEKFHGNRYTLAGESSDGKFTTTREKKNPTATIIAKEQGSTTDKVRYAERFSKGLDSAEEVSPGIREKVLSGEVKAPKSAIAELRKLDGEELKEAVEELKKPKEERKPKQYADVDTRKTFQLIRELSEDAGNIEKETAYTVENVVNDLEAAEDTFVTQIRFILRNRASVISGNEEAKEKVVAFIEGAIHDLNNIKEEM